MIAFFVVFVQFEDILMFDKGLYFDLVYQPFYQFRAGFLQGYLFYSSYKFSCVMLYNIYAAKPSFSQNFSKSEFLEETGLSFAQYFMSFGFLHAYIFIWRGQDI